MHTQKTREWVADIQDNPPELHSHHGEMGRMGSRLGGGEAGADAGVTLDGIVTSKFDDVP